VVRPDLVVGVNDDVQARGLHPVDDLPDGAIAWTGAADAAWVLLEAPGGRARLQIEGRAAPATAGGAVRLEVRVGPDPSRPGDRSSPPHGCWVVPSDGRPYDVAVDVDLGPGPVWVELRTDRTWSPAAVGASTDGRRLGLALSRVALEGGALEGGALERG
jgi:hypothetical protein